MSARTPGPWVPSFNGSPYIHRESSANRGHGETIQCHSREQAEQFALALNSYSRLTAQVEALRGVLLALYSNQKNAVVGDEGFYDTEEDWLHQWPLWEQASAVLAACEVER